MVCNFIRIKFLDKNHNLLAESNIPTTPQEDPLQGPLGEAAACCSHRIPVQVAGSERKSRITQKKRPK